MVGEKNGIAHGSFVWNKPLRKTAAGFLSAVFHLQDQEIPGTSILNYLSRRKPSKHGMQGHYLIPLHHLRTTLLTLPNNLNYVLSITNSRVLFTSIDKTLYSKV